MSTIRAVLMITTMTLSGLTAAATHNQNPHWLADACIACHVGASPSADNLQSGTAPDDDLCLDCHAATSESTCRHQSTTSADADMQNHMPAAFRASLNDNQIVCKTCHDLTAQCLVKRHDERWSNPMFLRAGPFSQRSDPCYLCHNESAYQKLNPHDQLTEQGSPRESVCLMCHTTIDSIDNETTDHLMFNVDDDLSRMCTGCHPSEPHPGSAFSFSATKTADHLVAPSPAMRKQMDRVAADNGVSLPLDSSSGSIYCATCHNPHDPSLPNYPVNATDEIHSNRLRLKDICIACHDI